MKKILFAATAMVLASAPAALANGYCREYTQKMLVGGRYEQGYGTACLQPDGSWRIVSSNVGGYGSVQPAGPVVIRENVYAAPVREVVYVPAYRPQPVFSISLGSGPHYRHWDRHRGHHRGHWNHRGHGHWHR